MKILQKKWLQFLGVKVHFITLIFFHSSFMLHFWIGMFTRAWFQNPKSCWVTFNVFEHLPGLADKEFCLIVFKHCEASSLEVDDLQCGSYIINTFWYNRGSTTEALSAYLLYRKVYHLGENGWIWRDLTIHKGVEGSVTCIKAALH